MLFYVLLLLRIHPIFGSKAKMTKSRVVVNLPRVQRDASALNPNPPPPNLVNETSQKSSSSGTLTPDSQQSQIFKMADAFEALTHGCLLQITQNSLGAEVQPVVQCVQIKPMNSQAGQERYRVVMSDSVNFIQGMLAQRMSVRMMYGG